MNVGEAFQAESAALVNIARSLGDDQLAAATRCGSWDVKTLLAHVVKGLDRAESMVANPVATSPDPNPLVYYQSEQRSDPERNQIRERAARAGAARFSSGPGIADAIAARTAAIVAGMEEHGGDVSVQAYWGPVMALGSYLKTRVIEVSVHGIDVADALDIEPWTTNLAAQVTEALLADLFGEALPPELGWSSIDFLRVGTGRRRLTSREEQILGGRASSFPLIW